MFARDCIDVIAHCRAYSLPLLRVQRAFQHDVSYCLALAHSASTQAALGCAALPAARCVFASGGKLCKLSLHNFNPPIAPRAHQLSVQ